MTNLTIEDSSKSQLFRIDNGNRGPFRLLAKGQELQLKYFSSFTSERYYEGRGIRFRYFIINNSGKDKEAMFYIISQLHIIQPCHQLKVKKERGKNAERKKRCFYKDVRGK